MFRIFSLTITIVAIIGLTIIIFGYASKPEYEGSVTFELNTNVNLLWQELVNIEDVPRKKQDVESVEFIEQYGRLSAWKENLTNGGYRIYKMNQYELNRKLEIELTESSYGLTGVWIIEFFQDTTSTVIKISEKSSLNNIRIRGIRTILGRDTDLMIWSRYIRVGIAQALLTTP